MRIVLDTNVLARAATGPPGPADELLLRSVTPPNLLCVSAFLLAELGRVLRYPRVRNLHGMTEQQIDDYVGDIQMASLVVGVPPMVDAVVPSDPNDDPIVATAVIAQAQVLSTLDRHLRSPTVISYCAARGIAVLTDLELLGRLRTGSP
jgi:putative PIN family toxin of toxin-antitoxin system